MDLTGKTPQEIGALLDASGFTWAYDQDGDVQVRIKSMSDGAVGPIGFEMQQDWSVHARFLDAERTQENGQIAWSILGDTDVPWDIGFKVLVIYFMPRPEGLKFQVHGRVEFSDKPMFISVVPSVEQHRNIENHGLVVVEEDGSAWLKGGFSKIGDDMVGLCQHIVKASYFMFEGPFTGKLVSTAELA